MTKKEKTAKCEPLDSQTDDSSLSSATKEAKSTKQVSATYVESCVLAGQQMDTENQESCTTSCETFAIKNFRYINIFVGKCRWQLEALISKSIKSPGYFLGIIRYGPMSLKFDGPFL